MRCIQPASSGFGRVGVDDTVRGDTERRLPYNDSRGGGKDCRATAPVARAGGGRVSNGKKTDVDRSGFLGADHIQEDALPKKVRKGGYELGCFLLSPVAHSMSDEPSIKNACRQCGQTFPMASASGLCPRCLIAGALDNSLSVEASDDDAPARCAKNAKTRGKNS